MSTKDEAEPKDSEVLGLYAERLRAITIAMPDDNPSVPRLISLALEMEQTAHQWSYRTSETENP